MKKVLKGLAVVLGAGAVLVVGTYQGWKASGSEQWQVRSAEDGITIMSRKAPGDTVEQFRATMETQTSLARIVAFMQDATICSSEWSSTCVEGSEIERVNDLQQTYLLRIEAGGPIKPREMIIELVFAQDPVTDVVSVDVTPRPQRLPQQECCIRISKLDNGWEFRPLDNGSVQVTFDMYMDIGGGVPDLLVNLGNAKGLRSTFAMMRELVEGERYADASFPFLNEAAGASAAALR